MTGYNYSEILLLQIIQPPPRRRCEKELHDRLVYLLSELEPWEQKLQQANKKAKIRLRKEHESYVEEPEPKVRNVHFNLLLLNVDCSPLTLAVIRVFR